MGRLAWPVGSGGGLERELVQRRQEKLFAFALEGREELTDVTFVLDDGWTMRGHRGVMSAGCDFLLACFSSGMKEAQEGVVRAEGCSREIFVAVAEFLYRGDVGESRLRGLDGGELLDFGAMWGVEGLQEWVLRGLDEGSVCRALHNAVEQGNQELVDECMGTVTRIGIEALGVEGLRGVGVEAMEAVLVHVPDSEGDEGLCLIERWGEANGGEAGWAQEQDCHRLTRHLCVCEITSAVLQRAVGVPWLFPDGEARRMLAGRMRGGEGWGMHSSFETKADVQLSASGSTAFLDEGPTERCDVRHASLFDDGAFCVANRAGQVAVFSADGMHEQKLGKCPHWHQNNISVRDNSASDGAGQLRCVKGLCVRQGTDTVYVLHKPVSGPPEEHHVAIYRRSGERVGEFGQLDGGGHVWRSCIAASADGDVYVGWRISNAHERECDNVQLYTADGTFVRVFMDGSDQGAFSPVSVAVSPRDSFVVILDRSGGAGAKVHVLSREGHVLRFFGDGVLGSPDSACVSVGGDIVLARGRSMWLFSDEGMLLQEVDPRIMTAPLMGPVALLGVMTRDGRLYAYYGADCIRVLGPSEQLSNP